MPGIAAREFLCEQKELMAPSRPFAPDKADVARGTGRCKRPGNETCTPDEAGLDRDRGQQCCSKPIVGHLHQGEKAGRFKSFGVPPAGTIAGSECMLAQTMTVLKQQQFFARKLLRCDVGFVREGMTLG